jgi:hypothetical protein
MANPLKVLAALSASAGAVVSGSAGLTVKQGKLYANEVELTGQLSSSAALTASTAHFDTVPYVGAGALALSSEIPSLTGYATETYVSNGYVAKDGSGNVTIAGTLTVVGGQTDIVSNIVNIGDKNLSLATGSGDNYSLIDGGGLSLGSGSSGPLVTLNYVSASEAWSSSVKFSATAFSSSGDLTIGGTSNLKGNVNLGDAAGDVITVSGTLNLSSSAGGVIADVAKEIKDLKDTVAGGTIVHANGYNGLRIVLTHELASEGEDSVFELTASNIVTGLSASTDALLATALAGASFDVAVRPAASNYWTNDLVSVHVTGSVSGSSVYPKFVVSAPALEQGASIRLIVVNENTGLIS